MRHEGSNFFQWARISLWTTNPTGEKMEIGATVKLFFGPKDSNEYVTYVYDSVPYSLRNRGQVTFEKEGQDLVLFAYLRNNALEAGEWYSKTAGQRVGTFEATKDENVQAPQGLTAVPSLSGVYIGKLSDARPDASFPTDKPLYLDFFTTQDVKPDGASISVEGGYRAYSGPLGTMEYNAVPFTKVTYNFYNHIVNAYAQDGVTYRISLGPDGGLSADVNWNTFGPIGTLNAKPWDTHKALSDAQTWFETTFK
jgi:hypothetical protein